MGSFNTRLRGVIKGKSRRRACKPSLVGCPGTAQETTWWRREWHDEWWIWLGHRPVLRERETERERERDRESFRYGDVNVAQFFFCFSFIARCNRPIRYTFFSICLCIVQMRVIFFFFNLRIWLKISNSCGKDLIDFLFYFICHNTAHLALLHRVVVWNCGSVLISMSEYMVWHFVYFPPRLYVNFVYLLLIRIYQ